MRRCLSASAPGRATTKIARSSTSTQRGHGCCVGRSATQPSTHVQTATGGVGMLPLDDTFEVHSLATQRAIEHIPGSWPGKPKSAGGKDFGPCDITSPPSISLSDQYLAIAAGQSYTQEWAIYPSVDVATSTYWSFINTVRADIGASSVSVEGAGYLTMYRGTSKETFLGDAGYRPTWEEMSTTELRELFDDQAMQRVHNSIPSTDRHELCRPGQHLYCQGSCFVHELNAENTANMQLLVNKTRAADPTKSLFMYSHSMISAEVNAFAKHRDSHITNSRGEQVVYARCAAGQDYPLFVATGQNSYEAEMMAYYAKALLLGFTGIFHDEFCGSVTSYTYSGWDGVSAVLDPKTKRMLHKLGHVCLLTQQNEMSMASLIRDHGGHMTLNGAPITRTWRRFAQQGEATRSALLHVVEDSIESRMMFLHLHTPIVLMRWGLMHAHSTTSTPSTIRRAASP